MALKTIPFRVYVARARHWNTHNGHPGHQTVDWRWNARDGTWYATCACGEGRMFSKYMTEIWHRENKSLGVGTELNPLWA